MLTLVIFGGLKDEKFIKKQTYTKTEAYKLYSRVFILNISAKCHQNQFL